MCWLQRRRLPSQAMAPLGAMKQLAGVSSGQHVEAASFHSALRRRDRLRVPLLFLPARKGRAGAIGAMSACGGPDQGADSVPVGDTPAGLTSMKERKGSGTRLRSCTKRSVIGKCLPGTRPHASRGLSPPRANARRRAEIASQTSVTCDPAANLPLG